MKLDPKQAPLYGACVLTVQLDDDDVCHADGDDEEDEAEFYLLFAGSTQRHLSSTLRVSHVTLQAVCPAHNTCEQVLVTLCWSRPDGSVDTRSQETFCFVQDLALDVARLLLGNKAPGEASLPDDKKVEPKECEGLGRGLSPALKHVSRHHGAGPAYVHKDMDGQVDSIAATVAETRKETLTDVSALLDGCSALRTDEAENRGRQQLFTQYEESSDDRVHSETEPRVFRYHEKLSTYTLTFGASESGVGRGCGLRDEVKELKRLIHLHRNTKRESDLSDTVTSTPVAPPSVVQLCTNGLQEIRQDAGLAVVTTGSYGTTTEGQGSPLSLKERTHGECPAVVTHTSCISGRLCQSQEAGGAQRGTPAASSPTCRQTRRKKRTAKAARRAGNRIPLEGGGGSARGSGCETPLGEQEAACGDIRVANSTDITTRETPIPIESASGGDGTRCGRKAVALTTSAGVEKQEGEEWEVDELICERAAEVEAEAATVNPQTGRNRHNVDLESETMGQEQSQDALKTQSDQELPTEPDSVGSAQSSRSPEAERKSQRSPKRDGGWIGSRMGLLSQGGETSSKTVWYGGESDQGVGEDSKRKEENCQSVWYTDDKMDEGEHEQLEQAECDLSSPQASGLGPTQLLAQGLSTRQLYSALSQTHAAGAQPEPSHGPAAQRQEVHGSQREEEIGPHWNEGGVEGGREEVSNTQASSSRKSCETADVEERGGGGGEEESGKVERGAKSRKKRRRKKGRSAGAEAKLSSSSSVESQGQSETQTQREQVTSPSLQSDTEAEARDQTGRALVQFPTASEPAPREEADKNAMHLPSQPESKTDARGPDRDATNPESSYTDPVDRRSLNDAVVPPTLETPKDEDADSLNLDSNRAASRGMDITQTHGREVTSVRPQGEEVHHPTEPDSEDAACSLPQIEENAETSSEKEDLTVAGEAACLLESEIPKELNVELTEDSCLMVFPELKTRVEPLDSQDKQEQPFSECVHSIKTADLPCEGTTDVTPLEVRKGTTPTTEGGNLEHCLSSEMPGVEQHKEENRNELWVDEEEEGTDTCCERSKEKDSGPELGDDPSSIIGGEMSEDEDFPSPNGETERNFDEDLVATAITVVSIAVASAVVSMEVQQSASEDPPLALDANVGTDAEDLSETTDVDGPARDPQTDSPASEGRANANSEESGCADPPLALDANVSTNLIKQPDDLSETTDVDGPARDLQTDSPASEGQANMNSEESVCSDPPLAQDANVSTDLIKQPDDLSETTDEDLPARDPQTDSPASERQANMNSEESVCADPPLAQDANISTDALKQPDDRPLASEESSEQADVNSEERGTPLEHGDQANVRLSRLVDSSGKELLNEETVVLAADTQMEMFTCAQPEGEVHMEPVTELNVAARAELDGQDETETEDQPSCPVVDMDVESKESKELKEPKDKNLLVESHENELDDPGDVLESDQTESRLRPLPTSSPKEESPVLTLQINRSDSAVEADRSSDESATPVNVETGEFPTSQSPENAAAVLSSEVAVEEDVASECADAVDGWRQRERDKMRKEEEEEVEESVTRHTEAELFPAEQTGGDSDVAILQIQRDRDVFYPVQPCPQPSPVTPCVDIRPGRDECVSVCVLHGDADGLKGSDELDDGIFKKPLPPPCLGYNKARDDCVSLSSIDDAATRGAPSPNDGAWSIGTPDTADAQSARLSWKSEPEERGGAETEEEEKKDQLPENPVSSAIMRASMRSLSPFRRHSWEPGRNNAAADMDVTSQHSSLKSLSGELKRAKPPLHRRSMSWCPSNLHRLPQGLIDNRSYSLEGLEVQTGAGQIQCPGLRDQEERTAARAAHLSHLDQERGSLLSLTEEEPEGDGSSVDSQISHQVLSATTSCPAMFQHQPVTKSMSMVVIGHRDAWMDGTGPFSSNSGSLEYSISEEEPGPLRSETEGKGGPKISRTFSYIRSKMTKKGKEKDKDRRGDRERDGKEKEKKSTNGHVFIPAGPPPATPCHQCNKPMHNKDTFLCNNCGVHVHKSCRECVSVCTKSKVKLQSLAPDAAPGSAVNMRTKSTSSASSVSSTSSSSSSRECWPTPTTPEDHLGVVFPRRHPGVYNPHSNLSKSISTSNIAGLDEVPLKGLKFLSQSTDSLHQGSKVNASTESLTDEGTEMMDSQLMGEFECDIKDLEADSWSCTVDKKLLKTLKKDEIKRQDVIYELYQTEFHHMRTLKIMSEVYYKGLQREVQLETDILDKIFPVLDDLLQTHGEFLTRLLETKRASSNRGQSNNSFLICRIGDVLVNQFSDSSADRMRKVYGKFCSRHNEAVNLYKDLHAKDKRFQAFIKRTMSSSIVRRLSIPECILLVTQRITKYPVLIQRILQHTKESDEDRSSVSESLRCVKELIAAVDSKVNEQEKKRRLREVHSRTDSKSIMRMKSGQMFAKEDLIRGRKLLHDGALQLKNAAGRLKDVQAMLLSDVLVFLQEKDQKYVFASLDQRSTVISLQNLIVRDVANAERGLFLITAGIEKPEMVEVLASSKEERNTWRSIIQDAIHCMEKDEDEGVPSETEEDRRQQENRAKEIRELLRRKDEQIVCLLEEKVQIFKELSDYSPNADDANPPIRERMLFRATPDDVTKGEPIMKDALKEVESLHSLINSGVGVASCGGAAAPAGGSVGPVCLPRRAETFGGFDSHQMNSSKNGDKEEGDESLDLRRTESDSLLKKGATASLQMLLKRNNEQVQHSVTHLHDLLLSLQAVVVQQDSFVEDQRQAMNDRLTANSSRHSSSSSLSSSSSSRPSSLIEQEKHRSLERQRQEAASLQKQQAAHQEEKRRREREWEMRERGLAEREERLREEEEEARRRQQELHDERETLLRKKEEYQRELERLREAQKRLERDKEALRRDTERLEAMRDELDCLQREERTPSTTSEDSVRFHSSGSLDLDSKEAAEQPKEEELSTSAPTKEPFLRIGSKRMGKNFNPFSSSKPKEKKEKKKKGKGGEQRETENKATVTSDPQNNEEIFLC